MHKEAKKARIPLMMEPSLVERIDTYRFTNRIGSRAEAVRTLVREALAKKVPVSAGE